MTCNPRQTARASILSTAFAMTLAAGAVVPDAALAEDATIARAEPVLDYFIVDQRIADVLAMIERDASFRIQPTDAVRGRVRRLRLEGQMTQALGEMAARHDLDLFTFGDTVYVSAKSEAVLRLIRLENVPKDRALRVLEEAGLAFAPGDVREAADGTALALTGPPRKLAIAEAIVESIPPASAEAAAPSRTVRVRRGMELTLEPIPDAEAERG